MMILLFEVAQFLVAPMVRFSSAINIRREDMKLMILFTLLVEVGPNF